MRRISLLLFCLVFSSTSFSQVVSPAEIKDPEWRALQEQYLDELKRLGSDILSIPTEYSFYLSRRLDLDEQQHKRSDLVLQPRTAPPTLASKRSRSSS
jgi:hypothetical protein